MRTACAVKSPVISKVASAACRGSPPATIDCSGSQYRTVPFTTSVFTCASASAPPMAASALLIRSCAYNGVVIQTPTPSNTSSNRVRFISPPYHLCHIFLAPYNLTCRVGEVKGQPPQGCPGRSLRQGRFWKAGVQTNDNGTSDVPLHTSGERQQFTARMHNHHLQHSARLRGNT